MKTPSSASHLYRLGILLFLALIVFLGIRAIATPPSWNYDISAWYRLDSPKDIAKLPIAHGDNDSCQTCHLDEYKAVSEAKHASLSCESCHGALADHVGGGKKVADARVNESRGQCLICHRTLVSRPKKFPQFSTAKVKEHKESGDKTACLACHDAHDPTP